MDMFRVLRMSILLEREIAEDFEARSALDGP